MPCNSVITDMDPLGEPHPDCNPDLEAQKKYLGPSNWLIYTNQQRFNPEGFGKENVEHYSAILNQQFDQSVPSW